MESSLRERERYNYLQRKAEHLEYSHKRVNLRETVQAESPVLQRTNGTSGEDEVEDKEKTLAPQQVSMMFTDDKPIGARKAFPRFPSLMPKRKSKYNAQKSSLSKSKRSRRRSLF